MIRKLARTGALQILGILAAIIFIAAAPQLRAQKPADPPAALTDDDSGVYSAVLREAAARQQ
jgi:hypothetical protein